MRVQPALSKPTAALGLRLAVFPAPGDLMRVHRTSSADHALRSGLLLDSWFTPHSQERGGAYLCLPRVPELSTGKPHPLASSP